MVILDASVILKWLIPEVDSRRALLFQVRHLSGEEHIVVPSLLFYEVANVLRYKENIPDDELVELYEILGDMELTATHPSFQELEETVLYARIKGISVYDATYVELARRLGCELRTADERLAKTVQEPFVKLL